jgi:hypothetical protein
MMPTEHPRIAAPLRISPPPATTFAQRCLRRAGQLFLVAGVLYALADIPACRDGFGDWAFLPSGLAYLLARILAPLLVIAAGCEFIVRRVDEFVTVRMDSMRKWRTR